MNQPLTEAQVQQIVQDELSKAQFGGIDQNPYHKHTGLDAPKIDIANIARFDSNPKSGDLTYYNGHMWVSLAVGSPGTVVTSTGTIPTYTSVPTPTITSATGFSYITNDTDIAANFNWQTVAMTNVFSNNLTWSGPANTFTVITAGYYLITGNIAIKNMAPPTYFVSGIFNGSTSLAVTTAQQSAADSSTPASDQLVSAPVSVITYCNIGDAISLSGKVEQLGSSPGPGFEVIMSKLEGGGSNYATYLSIAKVG
jgi:hypothetical protein